MALEVKALSVAWIGEDEPRMEVAHVDLGERQLTAEGTQLGAVYELRYRLEPGRLRLELLGKRSFDLGLDGADFFDLGLSPLFNSLPVVCDELMSTRAPRDYVMRWVDVPSLEVHRSEQRYEPLGHGRVRFRSGGFSADISFDDDGIVLDYPGLAKRVGMSRDPES
jgi:hypothetical protein